MRNFLRNILCRADQDKMKSVAMPAIGTGNLQIPPQLVTQVMYDEVSQFSCTHPRTTLRDISFVVYHQDMGVIAVSSFAYLLKSNENCIILNLILIN